MNKEPLVSIAIPNYNYARYLNECLESVLNQTYKNIEVIFIDNNSTDESLQIAHSYKKKFAEKGIYFYISKNKRNIGSEKNSERCIAATEGKYVYVLASDDALEPTFIEKVVDIFEKYPSVSMVMTHRKEMDDDGNIYRSEPFYNQNCIIKSEEQAAVFMMAGIAIPGQRMIRRGVQAQANKYKCFLQVAGDWMANFLLACAGDIAYIKEDLFRYRVHPGNETSVSEDNLLGIFEHYKIINHFEFIAKQIKYQKVADRKEEAVKKLGKMCFRYAYKMLMNGKANIALQYINLSLVFDDSLEDSYDYQNICKILNGEKNMEEIEKVSLSRNKSYNPPEKSIILWD